MKYTNVKLTVKFSEQFPYGMQAVDQTGMVACNQYLPMFSTANNSAKDVFLDTTLQKGQKEACEVALADFLLRSKAPQMWELLCQINACNNHVERDNNEEDVVALVKETLAEYEALLKGVYGK